MCEESLRDLRAFHRRRRLRAGRGGHGGGAQRHGADGESLVLGVPPGTQLIGADGDLAGRRWELLHQGQRATVARGGPGGRGNKHFATATRQAPRFAERGLAGEQGALELELKLLADVGLVGLPNAGKSSLLARLTRAAPKVASYPFTTLEPVLGVLESDERQIVIADIPGLIEGASEGAGLGHDFLAHIERTRLLVHALDIAPEASGAPAALDSYETIERELAAHDQRLARLPRVLALTKADLVSPERVSELVGEWRERLGRDVPVLTTSTVTQEGLRELAQVLFARMDELARSDASAASGAGRAREAVGAAVASGVGDARHAHSSVRAGAGGARAGAGDAGGARDGGEALAEHMVFRPAAQSGFRVERTGPRSFCVRGAGIERLLARFDVDNEDAMSYFEGRLRRIGVIKALVAEGFEAGDEVRIGDVRFELDPGANP